MAEFVECLGRARFAESRAQIRSRHVASTAPPDDVAEVGGIDRQFRADFESFVRVSLGERGGNERDAGDAVLLRFDGVDVPAALDAKNAGVHVRGEPFHKDTGGGLGFDRIGTAPAVAGSGHAVDEPVVGADAVEDLEKTPAAGEVHALSLDHGPFVDWADPLSAKLTTEPIMVVDQDDVFYSEPGRLHRRGAARFIGADDEEIGLDRVRAEGGEREGKKEGKGETFHS